MLGEHRKYGIASAVRSSGQFSNSLLLNGLNFHIVGGREHCLSMNIFL